MHIKIDGNAVCESFLDAPRNLEAATEVEIWGYGGLLRLDLPNAKTITISDCCNLREITSPRVEYAMLQNCPKLYSVDFPSAEKVMLADCEKLMGTFKLRNKKG